jgi:hypothetical protein
MATLYMVHFYGGPKHKQNGIYELLPEIRFPIMEDIKFVSKLQELEIMPPKPRRHVYYRQVGTDYIYKGIE